MAADLKSKIDRPTWVEIDTAALRHNITALQQTVPASRFMAVVKANAYGHDALIVARVALECGATHFGVATPHEGQLLREAGFTQPIVILGPSLASQARSIAEWKLSPSVTSVETAMALEGTGTSVHVKVNTGMNRSGIDLATAPQFIQTLMKIPGVTVEGLFSHFAGADDVDRFPAYDQFERFEKLLRDLRAANIRPPIAHICNTAAIIDMPEMGLDMVRAGLGMYGMYPSNFVSRRPGLRPVLSWKTKVVESRLIEAGAAVGYNGTFVAEKPTWISLLPVGYADGYRRILSNRGEVIVRGKRRRIAGRVSMDLIIIDSGDERIEPGEEVVLLGRQSDEAITADEMASWLGTNNYEVTTQISQRVHRKTV